MSVKKGGIYWDNINGISNRSRAFDDEIIFYGYGSRKIIFLISLVYRDYQSEEEIIQSLKIFIRKYPSIISNYYSIGK